jgi:predicted metal-dependent enzyme (double-stranded beta helix superfamily)
MGRRVEWKNSAGAIVGIDIAEFDTETAAIQAMNILLYEVDAYKSGPSSAFQINDPASIDSLVSTWRLNSFASKIISGVSAKGKVAIHTYHYNTQGNDTALFSAVTKEVSNTVSF